VTRPARVTLAAGAALALLALHATLFSVTGQAAQRWRDEPPTMKGLYVGWTGLVDPTGVCRFSVPANWKSEGADRLALAPDGSATAAEEWARSPAWSRYKADLYRSLKPQLLLEDSPRRLWFKYDAGWPGVHHYVAVPAADGACVLRIDVREWAAAQLVDIVEKIADSLLALP
jgi:hypothetical protein